VPIVIFIDRGISNLKISESQCKNLVQKHLQVEANYTTTVNYANYVDMSILRCFNHLLTRTCLPDDDDNHDDDDDGLYYSKHVRELLTM